MYPTARRSAERERRTTMISLLLVGGIFFGSLVTLLLTARG
jgi:hypothetical protein